MLSNLLAVVNVLSWGEVSLQGCVGEAGLGFGEGAAFGTSRDSVSYRSGIKTSRNNVISPRSVSALCFEVATRACPAAATCPVAGSLWQHCPRVAERRTPRTPERSRQSSQPLQPRVLKSFSRSHLA